MLSTARVLARLRAEQSPIDVDRLIRELGIKQLSQTSAQGDSVERASAKRVLANASVMLGFYEPRFYLEQHAPARAVAMLQALRAIAPWSAQHCVLLEQAARMADSSTAARFPRCDSQ